MPPIDVFGFDPVEDLLAQLLAINLAADEHPEVARPPGGGGLNGVYTTTYSLTAAEL